MDPSKRHWRNSSAICFESKSISWSRWRTVVLTSQLQLDLGPVKLLLLLLQNISQVSASLLIPALNFFPFALRRSSFLPLLSAATTTTVFLLIIKEEEEKEAAAMMVRSLNCKSQTAMVAHSPIYYFSDYHCYSFSFSYYLKLLGNLPWECSAEVEQDIYICTRRISFILFSAQFWWGSLLFITL